MMNKLLLIILTLLLSTHFHAQTWFEVGLKGGPASTFLLNKDIFEDSSYDHLLTGSYFYGGKIGMNFGPHNGIALHGGATKVNQNFNNKYEAQTFDRRNFNAQVIDIGLLYHRTKESGYFEIGPKISLVRSTSISDDSGERINIEEHMNRSYYGADVGFGGYLIGNERLSLMVGLRFSYGYAMMDKVEPITPLEAQYSNAGAVHVFNTMLSFELNYSLGYLVRSSCGRRTTWLSF